MMCSARFFCCSYLWSGAVGMHLLAGCASGPSSNDQRPPGSRRPSASCAMPMFSAGLHAQGGAGATSVPQMAQGHCAPQHVASGMRDASRQQRDCLDQAAQLRPAPSRSASGETVACSRHCCRAAQQQQHACSILALGPRTRALPCDDGRD